MTTRRTTLRPSTDEKLDILHKDIHKLLAAQEELERFQTAVLNKLETINTKIPSPDVNERTLVGILQTLGIIQQQGCKIMATLDEIQAKADAALEQARKNGDLEASIIGLVRRHTQMIKDLRAELAAAGANPAKIAKLGETMDQLAAGEMAEETNIAEAIVENTGEESPVEDPPVG